MVKTFRGPARGFGGLVLLTSTLMWGPADSGVAQGPRFANTGELVNSGTVASSVSSRQAVLDLIREGKPKQALDAYERRTAKLGREDDALLRQVAIGFILPLRTDMREQMRGAAYTALKEINSDEVVSYLEEGLSDGSGLVRALAAEGLGKLAAGQRSERFRGAIKDQAALVRVAVVKGLGRSGDRKVIPLIEPSLKDEQGLVRVAAAGALFSLGQTHRWNELIRSVSSEDRFEIQGALRLLGELKDPRGFPILRKALDDKQPTIRRTAAAALGDLGDPRAVAPLIRLLADPVSAVRSVAAVSLGEIGTEDAKAALMKALEDENPGVRAAAVSALLQQGLPYGEVADTVRGLIQDHNPGVRSAAARALSKGRGPGVIGSLSVLLEDPVPRPRVAAVRAVGRAGERQEIDLLKRGLRDSDEAVGATAGGALVNVLSRTSRT